MDIIKIAKEVLEEEAKALNEAALGIDSEIEKAVELILSLKGKLIVTGVGKSGLVGAKIAATLASTGTPAFFLHPTEALHGDLGMISQGDGVLAISYSGESEELKNILPHIKRFDIPLIAMAKDKSTTLGNYCNIFLSIKVQKEACPLDAAPTTSTTLTMAMGDVLAVCLMKRRGFRKEDFASFHPGGSLGKRLFIKVCDLARYENLPLANKDTRVKEAISIMTKGRLGSLIATDENGKLYGIFSDGDLRRALMFEDFSLEQSIEKYISKNPKVLTDENILASDALKIIEDYKIQALVITDKNNKPKGVLHIHDLVEAGIK